MGIDKENVDTPQARTRKSEGDAQNHRANLPRVQQSPYDEEQRPTKMSVLVNTAELRMLTNYRHLTGHQRERYRQQIADSRRAAPS
jgi:hypothetical protein